MREETTYVTATAAATKAQIPSSTTLNATGSGSFSEACETAAPIITMPRPIAAAGVSAGVGVAPAGASYVFNASGQAIDLGGLLCLFDADGPCANAVKDAQRDAERTQGFGRWFVVWRQWDAGDDAPESQQWEVLTVNARPGARFGIEFQEI